MIFAIVPTTNRKLLCQKTENNKANQKSHKLN